MSRTAITAQSPVGAYPVLPVVAASQDLTWTGTSDPTSRQVALVEAKTLVLARNADSASHTITFTSAPDTLGRSGDIANYSIGAGITSMFGPFKGAGWSQGGMLFIDVSDPHIQIAVINLP